MTTLLVIDAGNTRLKWARVCGDEVLASGAVRQGEAFAPDQLAPLLDSESVATDAVVIGSVVATALIEELSELLAAAHDCPVHVAAVQACFDGLTVAYADPGQLGVDRWLAMLGARRCVGYPCLVADLGTAVTYDAVAHDGQHLGGGIIAGRRLQREALFTSTERIGEGPQAQAKEDLFGADTQACVAAGVDHAIAAVVARAREALGRHEAGRALPDTAASQAQADPVPLLVTGGDAALMAPVLPGDTKCEPHLVLLGLVAWWEASQ
jgi:type III pantothenate kinase